MDERIELLKNDAEEKGFILRFLNRGKNFKPTSIANRYEFWLEGKNFDAKILMAYTVDELIAEGKAKLNDIMNERKAGRFNDE